LYFVGEESAYKDELDKEEELEDMDYDDFDFSEPEDEKHSECKMK